VDLLDDSVDTVGDQQPAPAAPKLRPRSPFRVSRLMLKELRDVAHVGVDAAVGLPCPEFGF